MQRSNSWVNSVLSAFSLVFILTGWIFFAPQTIGGQTAYVIIIGNSMEPEYHLGDLVLIRNASDYKVGDIVAYNYPAIGTVFHRIVKNDGITFILKGDNNSWEDDYKPEYDEIIGKLWLHIPVAGKFFQYLRKPGAFTLVVIIFTILIVLSIFPKGNRTNIKEKYIQKQSSFDHENEEINMNNNSSDTIYLISAVGFIALVLMFASFSQPIEQSAADNIEYTHSGYFEYYSEVPEDVFEGDVLQSGDPIYRQLNDSIDITYSYEISSVEPISIQGTYRLLAKISESSGWNRTIEIIPISFIVENSFTSSGILDLNEIQDFMDNFEEQTGLKSTRYTLSIIPEVNIQGTIGKNDFSDTFSPELKFSMDDQKIILLEESNTENGDVLNPVENGEILRTRNKANSISILGLSINILVVRFISLYFLAGSIIAFIWFYKKSKKDGELISNEVKADKEDETK